MSVWHAPTTLMKSDHWSHTIPFFLHENTCYYARQAFDRVLRPFVNHESSFHPDERTLTIGFTQYHFPYMKTPATMSGKSLIRFLKHFVHNKRSVLLDDHWSMIQGLRELDQWIHTIPFFVLLNSASISGFSFKLTRELLCNILIMNCSCDFEEEHPGTNSSWETLSQNGKKSVINILF